MVTLYCPQIEDLWFREQMLQDEQTMSYNHAYGGTIPFPAEKWAAWHARWISSHDKTHFYRYVAENGRFLGEIAYHFDTDRKIYLANVLIYAPYRNRGYGRKSLQLLCDTAAEHGIDALFDDIAIDNPSVSLFKRFGFQEIFRTDEYILVKKDLNI